MKSVMRIKAQLAKVFIALVLAFGVVTVGVLDTPAHAAGCTYKAGLYQLDPADTFDTPMAWCVSGSGYVRVVLTCARELDGRYPVTYYGPWVSGPSYNKSVAYCGLKGYRPIKVSGQTK